MDLYYELWKVKNAEVDSLRQRIQELEQHYDKVTKWMIRIHGAQQTMNVICPDMKTPTTPTMEK